MNLLHGLARLLHGRQRIAVDVCRLDVVDLLLQRRDLLFRLLQRALVRLFPSQRGFGGCKGTLVFQEPKIRKKSKGATYRLCYCCQRAFARRHFAPQSGSANVSPASAAFPAAIVALGWHSWASPCGSRPRPIRHRTSSTWLCVCKGLDFCLVLCSCCCCCYKAMAQKMAYRIFISYRRASGLVVWRKTARLRNQANESIERWWGKNVSDRRGAQATGMSAGAGGLILFGAAKA